MMQQHMTLFILIQKQKQLLMKAIFLLRLFQTYKNHLEKVQVKLLSQS